jgi:hypothetical protein
MFQCKNVSHPVWLYTVLFQRVLDLLCHKCDFDGDLIKLHCIHLCLRTLLKQYRYYSYEMNRE